MYELLDRSHENIIGIRVSGTLKKEDYDKLGPLLEGYVSRFGQLRVLILMEGWHGWDSVGAAWEDLKLDAKVNEHIERLAMVGDEDWEKWMAKLSKPFVDGSLLYFDKDQLDQAWAWLEQ